jgi:hypothetical protein
MWFRPGYGLYLDMDVDRTLLTPEHFSAQDMSLYRTCIIQHQDMSHSHQLDMVLSRTCWHGETWLWFTLGIGSHHVVAQTGSVSPQEVTWLTPGGDVARTGSVSPQEVTWLGLGHGSHQEGNYSHEDMPQTRTWHSVGQHVSWPVPGHSSNKDMALSWTPCHMARTTT